MILGMEPKNQVIWTTHCKVMAKYISIYCYIIQQKLVSYMSYSIAKEKKWSKNGWKKVPLEGGRGGTVKVIKIIK